ncbi:hypothetical protein RHODGE_RHODGE_04089 [Rhodoplanes serenus]|uniref:Phosphonate metabolism protein n=1 Tax=Rhodoplanes serenus TaxID=200615 RepID=A0A3S4FBN7_9BRAD|nr:DUF1045 domain-containing protein [Rhodoplanes serenus]MBI5110426.1 DUF1045 domain-containing protein [Rhodovulum sp.]VCU10490.1 hypothetical protein RHODGE_RHODGE_04089 [Rhodoplanes serenus]
MSDAPRYAVYFVPPIDSTLYRLGSALVGYDAYTGAELAPPADADVPDDWPAVTAEPRRYGFHATLKAPFRLAAGSDETALRDAVLALAGEARPLPVIRPVVRSLDGFVAVVPAAPDAALAGLAADCVTRLDGFRAPLSAEDRARRAGALATARQRENLERWGYPWVLDDFRFHMTLTGRIADEHRRATVAGRMAALVARHHGDGPLAIDRLVLLRQAHPDARFRVIATAPLRATMPTTAQPATP